MWLVGSGRVHQEEMRNSVPTGDCKSKATIARRSPSLASVARLHKTRVEKASDKWWRVERGKFPTVRWKRSDFLTSSALISMSKHTRDQKAPEAWPEEDPMW